MQFSNPLLTGTLIKRYKRFLADIRLDDGQEITAHCANSGAMLGIKEPGLRVWVSKAPPESKGKLDYRWELVAENDGTLVGANTSHPNKLIEEAWYAGKLEPLNTYTDLKREVKYGKNSRVDFLLTHKDETLPPCYVEVKNAHLCREKGLAEFPDSVTSRGAKHMGELANQVREGCRAYVVYVIQREDCTHFKIAQDLDPNYAKAAYEAYAQGVVPLAYACDISDQEILISHPIDVLNGSK
ncbi:MAG: DNA/RNA nuclease SfsA [bacterium]|nr:DNA/RNA nuclease SfsA [bacterium]